MKNLKFLLPVLLVFIVYLLYKLFTPEPTNWNPSYSKNDKIPYGSYILYEELNALFPKSKIETTNLPFYNLDKSKKIVNKNIIIICSYFAPDKLDSKIIFDMVKKGNDVFIAANSFGQELTDTFKLYVNYKFWGVFDSTEVNFVNPMLHRENDYKFTQGNNDHYFTSYDTSKSKVLGTNSFDYANYIKIKYGNGNLFLSTLPNAYTNYNLLKSNRDYVFKSLSYLKDRDVIWDEYYKEVNKYSSTPLRYILSQPALKWAYFTFLFAMIFFIIFKGKRDQRVIPVIKPLSNTTLEFIQTIGNVYFKQSNHKNIAEKRITYFLEYLRSKYSFKQIAYNEESIVRLSEKSLVDNNEIRKLFNLFNLIEVSSSIKSETLKEVNNQIENFYIKTGAYGK